MFNKKKSDIAVIGSGPAGLAASLGLHANGVEHVLFDESSRAHTHSYALALHPETLQRLDAYGLAQPILERALRVERIGIYDDRNRKLTLHYGSLPTKFPFIAVIGQDRIETILSDLLGARHHSPLWHHRVRFDSDAGEPLGLAVDRLYTGMTGYAVAHLATLIDKTFKYSVNHAIGADGHESSTRRRAGIDFEQTGTPREYAVFEFKADGERPDELRLILREGKTHVYWPLPDGYCRWSFELPAGDLRPHGEGEGHPLVQHGLHTFPLLEAHHLETLLGENAPWFDAVPRHIRWRTIVRFDHCLASAFGNDRLWLAGDAAHIGPPAGMLSMNAGIREALDLAECFANYSDDGARRTALEGYARIHRDKWIRGLDIGAVLDAMPEKFDWMRAKREQLAASLPVSDELLERLIASAEFS